MPGKILSKKEQNQPAYFQRLSQGNLFLALEEFLLCLPVRRELSFPVQTNSPSPALLTDKSSLMALLFRAPAAVSSCAAWNEAFQRSQHSKCDLNQPKFGTAILTQPGLCIYLMHEFLS